MICRQTLCALAGGLLCAVSAHAQLATAFVAVQVRGPSPAGVEVRLLPIDTIDRAWSARSGVDGRLVFPRVDAGTYRLVLPAVDKASAGQPLQIAPGDVLTIAIDAGTAALTIVERHRSGYRTDFSASDLTAYPSSGDIWSLIEAVDPVALVDRIDTSGVSIGQPALIGSHASSWTQASFFDQGVNVTSALAGGVPLLYPDIHALRGFSLVTANAPLEVAAPGPVTVLIPAAPSILWHWSADADVSPHGGRARPAAGPPSIRALTSWTDGAIAGGGPAGPRAGITLAFSSTRSTHTERGAAPALPGNLDSISGGFVVAPSDEEKIDLRASLQQTRRPFDARARLEDRFAVARDRFGAIRAAWQQGSTSPRWIDAALQLARTTATAASPMNGTIERLRDGPVPLLALSNPGTGKRWTIDAGAAPRLGDFDRGRHAFTFGVELSRSSATTTTIGDGPIGETIDGIPARAWVYTHGGTSPQTTTGAIYADDRYTPSSRVSLNAGLRLETVSGASGGASERVRFTNVAPRLSVRWLASTSLTLVGSFRRYDDELPLIDLAFGDPLAPQASVYRWEDQNGDGLVQPGELGTLIARAGPGSADGLSAIDPRLARPRTDEVTVGLDATVARWNVRLAGIATRERRLIGLTDSIAQGEPAYTVTDVADPGVDLGSPMDDQQLPVYARSPATFGLDRYLLTNPLGLNAAFNGVELTIAGAVGPLRTLVGAAAMRSHGPASSRGFLATENDQGLAGELLVDPNAATFADGRLYFDPGYSAKWSAVYAGAHGIRAAIATHYQDGQNFARLVIAPDLPQGAEAIRAYANGRSKFTYRFAADARLEKRFAIGRGRVAAVLDVYNLFNTSHEVEENVVTGPAFRTPTALQPPRVVRVGVRLAY